LTSWFHRELPRGKKTSSPRLNAGLKQNNNRKQRTKLKKQSKGRGTKNWRETRRLRFSLIETWELFFCNNFSTPLLLPRKKKDWGINYNIDRCNLYDNIISCEINILWTTPRFMKKNKFGNLNIAKEKRKRNTLAHDWKKKKKLCCRVLCNSKIATIFLVTLYLFAVSFYFY
jgi:hypothetical protein